MIRGLRHQIAASQCNSPSVTPLGPSNYALTYVTAIPRDCQVGVGTSRELNGGVMLGVR